MKKLIITLSVALVLIFTMAFAISAETITVTDDGTTELTLGDCVIEGLDKEIPKPSSGFTYQLDTEAKTAKITKWESYADATIGAKFVIPSTVTYEGNTYTVTSFNDIIGYTDNGAGKTNGGNYILTHIYIPDTLVTIPNSAFQNCHALEYVYIGSGLETWGENAFNFAGCTAGGYYVTVTEETTDEETGEVTTTTSTVPIEKAGGKMGNIKEFVLKSKKVTALPAYIFHHTEFEKGAYIEMDITQFTTFGSMCISLNQHALTGNHYFEGTGLIFDVFDLRNATSIANDAFYFAYGGKTMIVYAEQTKYFKLDSIRGGGSAYYNPDTTNDATFVIIGGDTPETARTLGGPIWTANLHFWYGSTIFMNVVITGYVNAYDGTEGVENPNSYGIDQVDYFFESEAAFNHYIESVKTTTNAATTFTRYGKSGLKGYGYFNVCQGDGTLKAYDLKYTAAIAGVEDDPTTEDVDETVVAQDAIVEIVEVTKATYIREAMKGEKILGDDCTASTICICCEHVFVAGLEHKIGTTYEYADGYTNNGLKVVGCTRCLQGEETTLAPLFTSYGYSKDENGVGIVHKVKVDKEAITAYEEFLTEQKGETVSIYYGIVAAISSGENSAPVSADGKITDGYKAVVADMTDTDYTLLSIKICGITDEETALNCNVYIIVDNKVKYINDNKTGDYASNISYKDL